MKFVICTKKNQIGYITINRPEKKNALSNQVVVELREAFSNTAKDGDIKVVILNAKGNVYCSGADLSSIKMLQEGSDQKDNQDTNNLKALFFQIYTLPKVVIALIQGHAIAGGSGLATVCDYSFSVPNAKFGYPEVKIGFVPAIVMVFLLKKIGEQKTRNLLLSGKLISAKEAVSYGMITEIFYENLEENAFIFAQKLIAENSTQSMATIKKMINKIEHLSLEDGLEVAVEENIKARTTEDCKRGITAFLNKKSIQW